jgi:hypothetical protein
MLVQTTSQHLEAREQSGPSEPTEDDLEAIANVEERDRAEERARFFERFRSDDALIAAVNNAVYYAETNGIPPDTPDYLPHPSDYSPDSPSYSPLSPPVQETGDQDTRANLDPIPPASTQI